jgi:bacillithiol biosynthesis cysteine-adding enzyme BshC
MAERPRAVLDYGDFQQPPNALFRDYLTSGEGVRPFYAGARWDLADIVEGSSRRPWSGSHRSSLAQALARQQDARGATRAAARARVLAQEGALAVVSGQQPGLFGGPLFVLYKAAAVLRIAEALEERRGDPVVPVFWVAADDHDFAEVRAVNVVDDQGRLRAIRYAPEREPVGQPASGIVLDGTITALVEELHEALPGSAHGDAVLAALVSAYRPGATVAGAFGAFLSALLPDLVVLDPSDPSLKALMAPVFQREILEASPTSRLASAAAEDLLAAGYHQQVPVRPGFLNLFVIMEGQRRSIATQNGDIEVRGLGRRLSVAEAARLVTEDPSPWSPGVLLRPLAQDHLLPTAAYVGGPAEIAYHAQIGPSYAHFGIPRPPLVPRPGVTLVEPAQARVLEAEGLALPEFQKDPELLVARWAREAYPEVEAAFAQARGNLERDLTEVEERLGAIDPTLRGAADGARGRALHQIGVLQEKATRALKKRDQARGDKLRRTRDALFPGGAFQERGIGVIGMLWRHGLGLVGAVRERIDPWAKGHQVLYL